MDGEEKFTIFWSDIIIRNLCAIVLAFITETQFSCPPESEQRRLLLLAVLVFVFSFFFSGGHLNRKRLHFVKSQTKICPAQPWVLWEYKLVIDLKLLLLPLPLARDLHLAGSGWWVDQIFTRCRVGSVGLCYDQLLLFVLLILSF